MILISIGEAAKILGVTPQTLRNWVKQGVLKEYRTAGKHRRFDIEEIHNFLGIETKEKKTVIYARVSGQDQKQDLERQTDELEKYCQQAKIQNPEVIKDIGSGINYTKKGLKKLIQGIIQGEIGKIVICFEDRLLRFGIEILFQICDLLHVEIVTLKAKDKETFEAKLVEDVLAILLVYASKIYGKRSHTLSRKNHA